MRRTAAVTAAAILGLTTGAIALAWHASPVTPHRSSAGGIAIVDALKAVRLSLSGAEQVGERTEMQNAYTARSNELRARIEQNQAKLRVLVAGDPEFATTQAALQTDISEFQQLGGQARADLELLTARQATEAYTAIYDKAIEIAKSAGYTHLIASQRGAEALTQNGEAVSRTTGQVTQEMLSRVVLLAPEGDDITQQLLDALGLKDEPAATPSLPAPEGG